jgi:hypothetical protein
VSAQEQKRAQKELQRDQQRASMHSSAQSTMFQDDGSLNRRYIEALTETSLDQGTIDMLDNLVTRDWILGKLEGAEVTETKWLTLELARVEIDAMHPPRESNVTDARRAFMLDDPKEEMPSLNERERKQIENFLRAVFTRVSRSRQGWQQREMSRTINVSEVKDQRDEKDGLLDGLLGR